jgi:DNA-directed RNA polymerase subunit RPC12/RpoP
MDKEESLENCPHCGTKLSPWQKVLLNVDRAIVCKKCWYRIILEPKTYDKSKKQADNKEKRRNDGNV